MLLMGAVCGQEVALREDLSLQVTPCMPGFYCSSEGVETPCPPGSEHVLFQASSGASEFAICASPPVLGESLESTDVAALVQLDLFGSHTEDLLDQLVWDGLEVSFQEYLALDVRAAPLMSCQSLELPDVIVVCVCPLNTTAVLGACLAEGPTSSLTKRPLCPPPLLDPLQPLWPQILSFYAVEPHAIQLLS
jgi:hypothetical protein